MEMNMIERAHGPRLMEVAERHRFDAAALDRWLTVSIESYAGELKVQQIVGGSSNPTFLMTTGDGHRYVLRKKPPGALLASAHQVDREFRVMQALADSAVPVPVMRALCQDDGVIGTGFYVMDYLEGRIFRDASLPGLAAAERRAIYDQLNAVLAALHRVDYHAAGLDNFGRPAAYFARQCARWTTQYRSAQTGAILAMDALIEELPLRIPAEDESAIAHGDYRLENVMFHPTEPRLIAVLDWELSTIGHPLADLGYNALLWHSHSPSWGSLDGVDLVASGIPGEQDYVATYCQRTGRGAISDWNFYLAFAAFRLASISQGVFARALAGQTPNAAPPTNAAPALAEQALEMLRRS
jgi:aminoglycoside phosphotransferase (APT) family kinase protein